MPRGLDDGVQQAFIDRYENLLNTMGSDETVVFVDAAHPTHRVRPAGCWARKGAAIAVEQTTGRDTLNINGAINLETGGTQILTVEKVDGLSLIKLLGEVERTHTAMRLIHVFFGQRQLSQGRHRQRVACEGWTQSRAALPSTLLPPSQSHRAGCGA